MTYPPTEVRSSPEYLTHAQLTAMTTAERFEHKRVTGNPEQDFDKLVRTGCIDGKVENPEAWRREMRRRARRSRVPLRTYAEGDHVFAYTLHYERELAREYRLEAS